MSTARAAVAIGRRGIRVHPLRPGRKEPILDAWQKRASMDVGRIMVWWQKWPNANVGIACGGPARLLVVDVDPDKEGEASISQLEAKHAVLPATTEAVTRSGGRHLYYFVPSGRRMPGNSAGKLGLGLDTRGEGGYVVAPPSVVEGRLYTWSIDSSDRIAFAPDWLLDLLECGGGNGKATPPEEWHALALQGVDAGGRNQAVAKLAGLLFRRLPDATMAAELVACFNAMKCRPPLGAEALKRILDSIAAREMRRQGLTL